MNYRKLYKRMAMVKEIVSKKDWNDAEYRRLVRSSEKYRMIGIN